MFKNYILPDLLKKKLLKNFLMYILPCMIIMTAVLYFIHENTMIKIVADEYGYWASAAYMTGRDWSEVTSYNAYYSYGYGVILALILMLNLSATLSYQIAIAFNGICLCGMYIISIYLTKEFCKNKNISETIQILIALCITLFSGNLYYSQYTLPEVLINFLYWIVIYLAYELIKKVTFGKSFLFLLVLIYSFTVHQRMLGICVISFGLWLFLISRDKNRRRFWILSLVIVLLGAIIVFFFKNNYQAAFFSNANSQTLSMNDFSGQTDKVKFLLSLQGIWMFIKAYVGKIYYALSSTYLLAGVGGILIFIKAFSAFKNRKREKFDIALVLPIFIILNFVVMMAIASVFMINYYGRIDFLIYGRYFEFTLSPLVFYALVSLVDQKGKKIYWLLLSIPYIIISVLINYIINYETSTTNVFISCPSIADILIRNNFAPNSLLIVMAIKIFVFAVLLLIFCLNKKAMKIIALGGICILNISTSKYVYEKGCLSWAVNQSQKELKLAEIIKENKAENLLYYYAAEDSTEIDYLQFLLKDYTVHCFVEYDEIESISEKFILTIRNSQLETELNADGYGVIGESHILKLWSKE